MAIKKSVRLTDPTIEALRPFSEASGEGMNWSGSINSMAEHISIFVDELTPELTESQWKVFYCLYNGYTPHPLIQEEIKLLPWHVAEGVQYDAQVAEFLGSAVDAAKFIELVKAWSTGQRAAVIYKAKSFWRNGPVADDPHGLEEDAE